MGNLFTNVHRHLFWKLNYWLLLSIILVKVYRRMYDVTLCKIQANKLMKLKNMIVILYFMNLKELINWELKYLCK